MYQSFRSILSFLLIVAFTNSAMAWQQKQAILPLQKKLAYQPQHFRAAAVTDGRTDGSEPMDEILQKYLQTMVDWPKDVPALTLRIDKLTFDTKVIRRSYEVVLTYEFAVIDGSELKGNPAGFVKMMSTAYPDDSKPEMLNRALAELLQQIDATPSMWRAEKKAKVLMQVEIQTKDAGPGKILYNKNQKLTIHDFMASPDASSPGAAATSSNFGFSYKTKTANNTTTISVVLFAAFDKNKSWFKKNTPNPNKVLAHEQLHFDITALIVQRMKKNILNADWNLATLQQDLQKMYSQYSSEWDEMETAYDIETKNGLLAEQQALWTKKVEEELAGY